MVVFASRRMRKKKLKSILKKNCLGHIPAIDVSLHTGMRAGGKFSMKSNQIEWEQRILSIPKTKNGHARHIPLNAIALAALRDLQKRNGRSPWVFLNRLEGKLCGARDWFEPAVEKAGLADYT